MSATAADHDHHGAHHGRSMSADDPQYGVASPGKIAMWIFLLSDGFSFGGLLLTYGILRGGAKVWPPTRSSTSRTSGINFTAGLTFLLICSSVTMVLAHAAAVEGNRKKLVTFLGAHRSSAASLFLCGQTQEYFGAFHFLGLDEGLIARGAHLRRLGVRQHLLRDHELPRHARALGRHLPDRDDCIRAAMGKYDNGNHDHIEILGLFWHFVDLVWILVFTFIYLL